MIEMTIQRSIALKGPGDEASGDHATNSDHWSTLKNTGYIGELENVI